MRVSRTFQTIKAGRASNWNTIPGCLVASKSGQNLEAFLRNLSRLLFLTVKMFCSHTGGLHIARKQVKSFHVMICRFFENIKFCSFFNYEATNLWKLLKIEDIKCHTSRFPPQFDFLKNIKWFVRYSNLESSENFWSYCIKLIQVLHQVR